MIGRLTRDPELRYTPSGMATARFSLAVDRGLSKEKKMEFESKNQPTADFINIVAWGKTAELCANYLNKGRQVGIEGRIQTGSYEKEGRRIYTTDVVVNRIHFIGSAAQSEGGFERPAGNQPVNNAYQGQGQSDSPFGSDDDLGGFYPVDNDDIPF